MDAKYKAAKGCERTHWHTCSCTVLYLQQWRAAFASLSLLLLLSLLLFPLLRLYGHKANAIVAAGLSGATWGGRCDSGNISVLLISVLLIYFYDASHSSPFGSQFWACQQPNRRANQVPKF